MAGIAYYEGIRRMGAGLIRVGPGLPAMQWETIERLQPTTLVAVPSFLVKLIEYAQAKGIDLNTSSVKKAICIGEGLRTDSLELNTIGGKIKHAWNIGLYSTYASTEMQTAFTECGAGRGGHLHPELIHVELLDDAGNPVEAGEAGEVTITTLGVEGMPLLRYRTGDICHLHTEACSCGRNTPRLGPVIGRKQQMIKLKGTTLYPPAIFDIVQQVDHIHDYVVEAFTGKLGTDEVKLYISVIDGQQQNVERSLLSAFQSRLRVVPEIAFTPQKDIEALQQTGGRKLKKFVDRR
jgi:phenylacetate-CoA ligase